MKFYRKFKFKGSRFVHLCQRQKGAIATRDVTVCGLRSGRLWGSVILTQRLDGTECERCLTALVGRRRWVMVPDGLRTSGTPAHRESEMNNE